MRHNEYMDVTVKALNSYIWIKDYIWHKGTVRQDSKGGLRETKQESQQVYLWFRHDRQGYGLFHGEYVSDLLSYGHY